jgi:hypothetical protein
MERPDTTKVWGMKLSHEYPKISIYSTHHSVVKGYTKWGHVSSKQPTPDAYNSRCATDEEYFREQFSDCPPNNDDPDKLCLIPGDEILWLNGERVFTFFELKKITENLRAQTRLVLIAKRYEEQMS